jgi:hypothetical protein
MFSALAYQHIAKNNSNSDKSPFVSITSKNNLFTSTFVHISQRINILTLSTQPNYSGPSCDSFYDVTTYKLDDSWDSSMILSCGNVLGDPFNQGSIWGWWGP